MLIYLDLEDELDDLQQYTRRDQIIIDNMPEKADEITDQIVLEQCTNGLDHQNGQNV